MKTTYRPDDNKHFWWVRCGLCSAYSRYDAIEDAVESLKKYAVKFPVRRKSDYTITDQERYNKENCIYFYFGNRSGVPVRKLTLNNITVINMLFAIATLKPI